jgi:hypothetical protein
MPVLPGREAGSANRERREVKASCTAFASASSMRGANFSMPF